MDNRIYPFKLGYQTRQHRRTSIHPVPLERLGSAAFEAEQGSRLAKTTLRSTPPPPTLHFVDQASES